MRRIEVLTGVRHSGTALAHPRWWWAALAGGRRGLLRAIVSDSLRSIRAGPAPPSIEALLATPVRTPIGALGAPQEVLYGFVRLVRPATIVETGVYRGVSSAFLLAGLADNGAGRLVSLDLPGASYFDPVAGQHDSSPLTKGESTGFAIPDDLRRRWRLELGDSRERLESLLEEVGPIDVFLHDSAHTAEVMSFEFATARRHLKPGGWILSDDAHGSSAWSTLAATPGTRSFGLFEQRMGFAQIPPLGSPP